MSVETRRHLLLLALALACWLELTLQGCAITRGHYTWFRAEGAHVSDFYRWERVDRAAMPLVCGYLPADQGACALQLRNGIVRGGKTLDGAPSAFEGEGAICIIFGTMDESEARRMMAMDGEMTMHRHELKHCHGWRHAWTDGRVQ